MWMDFLRPARSDESLHFFGGMPWQHRARTATDIGLGSGRWALAARGATCDRHRAGELLNRQGSGLESRLGLELRRYAGMGLELGLRVQVELNWNRTRKWALGLELSDSASGWGSALTLCSRARTSPGAGKGQRQGEGGLGAPRGLGDRPSPHRLSAAVYWPYKCTHECERR